MSFMPPTDSMFLLAENRDHPMHVGGLQLFVPPDGCRSGIRAGDARGVPADRQRLAVVPQAPGEPVGTRWRTDETIDYDHHVRHSAVPSPGRIRELLQLTSRWHGSLLDRHRPLWEVHVVEGLQDGRVAVYSKVHHAMVDGVSALRLMQRSLSEDPSARDCLPPWALPARKSSGDKKGFDPLALMRSGAGVAGDIAGLRACRPQDRQPDHP